MAASTTKKAGAAKKAPAKKSTKKAPTRRATTSKVEDSPAAKKRVNVNKGAKPGKDVIDIPVLPTDPDELERLVSLVPSPEVLDEYEHRVFEDGLTDFEFFEYNHKAGNNVLLPGDTGSGKTHALMAYAAWKRLPFGWLEGSRLARIEDVFGDYQFIGEKTLNFVLGDFALIFKYGGVYVIDEVNMIIEGVSSKLFAALDDRRTIQLNNAKKEHVQGTTDVFIAAAYNPGYAGGRELNRALKRRFTVRRWNYDETVEKNLVVSSHLLDVARHLRVAFRDGVLRTPTPTSLLTNFEEDLLNIWTLRDFDAAWSYVKACLLDQFEDDEREPVRHHFDLKTADMRAEYLSLWKATVEGNDDTPDEDDEGTVKVATDSEAEPEGDTRKVKTTTASVTGKAKAMSARYSGKCKTCGEAFPEKTDIVYGGKSRTYHDRDACIPAGVEVLRS